MLRRRKQYGGGDSVNRGIQLRRRQKQSIETGKPERYRKDNQDRQLDHVRAAEPRK